MSNIDKSVAAPEHLGYPLAGREWRQPVNATAAPLDADALFALVVKRANELTGAIKVYESELEAITDAIDRKPGGKG